MPEGSACPRTRGMGRLLIALVAIELFLFTTHNKMFSECNGKCGVHITDSRRPLDESKNLYWKHMEG